MKKIILMIGIILLARNSLLAQDGFEGRLITDNIWMPTGYTLHKSEFDVGLGPIGIGLNENIQIGTNILLFLFQVYNANIKITMIHTENSAIAAGLEYSRFNLSALIEDQILAFNTVSPFLALSVNAGESMRIHLAAKYSYFTVEEDIDDYKPTSASSGTEVMIGLENSISYKTKLLLEGGYDITFEGLRLGGAVLFGWETFRLKLGVSYYAPKNAPTGYSLPIIGLWWRFDG